jgi:uncharacterized protein YcbK (DUF882 family)
MRKPWPREIAPYFTRREFACRCGCGFDTVDTELLAWLVALRRELRAPVVIRSGCRCASHNREVNGAPHSRHLIGRAADIVSPAASPAELAARLDQIARGRGGIIEYPGFVHLDSRTGQPWRDKHQ